MVRRAVLGAAMLALLAPASAAAATYYVDPAGNDAAAGTSAATAWRTLGKVGKTTLQPGDQVLLKAGVRHGDMLQLRGSGTAAAPIVVSTYGTGRARLDPRGGGSGYAGIVLQDNAFVRFEHLDVAGWGAGNPAVSLGRDSNNVTFDDLHVHDVDTGFLAPAGSTPHDIAIRGSTIDALLQGRGSIGINLTKGAYRWTVTGTRVANAGDSCIIDLGHDNTYDGLTITDCGHWIVRQYGGHGAYLRGPNLTIRNSDVSNAPTNCVSIRFQNAVVEGNTLHGCAAGIAYFEYATANDSNVRLLRNRIWDTKTAIYIDFKSKQRFLMANNTILADREGIVVRSGTALAIENTIITGSASTLVAYEGIPAGAYVERNNVLATTAGGSAFSWPGGSGDLAGYRSATGQGAGSTAAAPVWAAGSPDFVPAPGSEPVDSGTPSPATGALTPACDGHADHYCGAAPERGARELDPSGRALPAIGVPPPPRAAGKGVRPVAPAGVRLLSRTADTVTLTWRPARDPDGRVVAYRVIRLGADGKTGTQVRKTRATIRVHPGWAYRFRVYSVDNAGLVSKMAQIIVRPGPPRGGAALRALAADVVW